MIAADAIRGGGHPRAEVGRTAGNRLLAIGRGAALLQVAVDVVVVRCIGLGAEHGGEDPAGRIVDFSQKFLLG